MQFRSTKIRYSIEPRDRIYVKGYGFLFFEKNMSKILSNKCCKKLFDSAKKSTTGAIKTAAKRAIQKTAEATGDSLGSNIAKKISSALKRSPEDLRNNEMEAPPKKANISRRKAMNY